MDREHFLAHVKHSLGAPEDQPAGERYHPPEPPSRPDAVDQLIREHQAVGGIAYRVSSPAEARDQVMEVLATTRARQVIRGATSLIDQLDLDPALERANISLTIADLAAGIPRDQLRDLEFAADAGITSVDYGVAETGTLALLAAPGQGRGISLLPPVHIAVLEARHVVYELAALFEAVTQRGELPSALTFVTGPSRTGDIEQKLTIGVHGPQELHLILIE